MSKRLLSVAEVAEQLGTPERFVRRLIHERRIPYTKIGKYVRIATGDLDDFIASGRVEPGTVGSLKIVSSKAS